MNDLPKEEIDKILSGLAKAFGADNVLVVYGGPGQGIRIAMRRDETIEIEALRENVVSMINETCRKIMKSEQEQSRKE